MWLGRSSRRLPRNGAGMCERHRGEVRASPSRGVGLLYTQWLERYNPANTLGGKVMAETLHVVSHTHWDREWYLPFQVFRLRLVNLIDNLLDILETDEQFAHFSLDAQTIVLEDYLQIRPAARPRLERMIRAGRIGIGPWYQLNDEYLVSGESTVRSLLLGHRVANEFGACLKIGYLPDQFGNIGQMPQIFRGFGIDNCIFGRGYQLVDGRTMEFTWASPDGSAVTASLMALWYNNAQYIGADPSAAAASLAGIRDAMAARSAINSLLLMNGVDHLEARPDIGRLLVASADELERLRPGVVAKHSTLASYVQDLLDQTAGMDLAVHEGELREDRGGSCLAGTLSARMYLKQANHHSQTCLEQYAERLSAFARISGRRYPAEELRYAWKLLMNNHPHDSICGCSLDEVHNDMMARFVQVDQIAGVVTQKAMDALVGRDVTVGAKASNRTLLVANTLSWVRTDPVVVTIDVPLGEMSRGAPPRDDSLKLGLFRLLDAAGREVPYAVVNESVQVKTVLNPHELPLDQWVQSVTLEFIAEEVPACGYTTFTIVPGTSPAFDRDWAPASGLMVPYLEDGGDVGDEYLYRPPLSDKLFRWAAGPSDSVVRNAVRQTREWRGIWDLPCEASGDHKSRSDALVPCSVVLSATSWRGVDRVEYAVRVDNRAKDHRLRVAFDLPRRGCEPDVVLAEGQFDVVERPFRNPLEAEGADPNQPQQLWAAVEGVAGSESVCYVVGNEGLPSYQAVGGDATATVFIPLLRCVGQLSGRGDGPGILTPGAQCQGESEFRLSLSTSPAVPNQPLWRQPHQAAVPLVAVQGPDVADASLSYLQVSDPSVLVTAIKRCEDRDTLVVRAVNLATEQRDSVRLACKGAARWRIVDLNEEPIGEWQAGATAELSLRRKQIGTVEFDTAD